MGDFNRILIFPTVEGNYVFIEENMYSFKICIRFWPFSILMENANLGIFGK